MATNALLTPSLITKETLAILSNNLVAAGKVNRQFENQFVKIGTTLTVRKPVRFKVTRGPALQIQDITEPSTSITVSQQAHVDWQFSCQELTLTIEDFSERYCKPAAEELANDVDYTVLGLFSQLFNQTGTPGTAPSAFADLADVGQRMDEGAVPQESRVLVLSPKSYWAMAKGLIGYYVQNVSEPAFKGFLANIANFEIFMDQNVQAQTVGNWSGTPVVNGAGQTGGVLVTNGWTASVSGLLALGDIFTITGVYAINPKNRQSTGALQNFLVTSAVTSDAGGNAAIGIYPAITTSGAYQTVSAAPANGASITVKGAANTSYFQNVAFTKDCFGLVTVPMELPNGVDFVAREMHRNISMRIVRAFDIFNDVTPARIDILYGVACFYPELGVRVTA